jgi:hypothetical protein
MTNRTHRHCDFFHPDLAALLVARSQIPSNIAGTHSAAGHWLQVSSIKIYGHGNPSTVAKTSIFHKAFEK